MSIRKRLLGRKCPCGASITDGNSIGLCPTCNLRSPANEAKRKAAVKARWDSDPAWRCFARANMRRVGLAAGRDPVITARRREHGKTQYATFLDTPEVRAKVIASRPAATQKMRDTKLAWCPVEYRDEYLFLLKRKKIARAEAMQMVLAMVEVDKAKRERAEAALSPF